VRVIESAAKESASITTIRFDVHDPFEYLHRNILNRRS